MLVRNLIGGAAALSLLLAAPVMAHADTYAAGTDNQDFATSQGGWTATSSTAGLCVAALLCPAVSNTYAGSAGASGSGDGYIRTGFSSLLSTVAGTSTGVWESPAFTYDGNGGAVPATVSLDLSIRPQVSALLGLSVLNDSSYRVDLVDQSTGSAVSAVPTTALTVDNGWTAVPTASISPALLTIGHSYKTRITTSYHSVLTVIASGEVGYDNVRLTTAGTSGGGGGGGGGGTNGGSGITTVHQLTVYVKNIGLPSSAKLVGNKLKVRIKCPKKASPKACSYAMRGLAKGKKSGPATAKKVAVVNHGRARLVTIKVKPRYAATYQNAKKIFIKATVRVGNVRVTVVKKVRLRHI